jgi:hydroxymethylpyrimidine/phosphomethylpyrimidine kinase
MTAAPPSAPIALTIAGSDSGGGAGIQADLKTFAALGVFGTSAITAITAQNPDGVTAIQGIEPMVVAEQVRQVCRYFPVGGAKTGMLFSREIIAAVANALEEWGVCGPSTGGFSLVVDPVMVATSGAKLLADDAIGALCELILPRATLITPNMDEAALLAGRPVLSEADQESAARALHERFGVPVLVKGGHLKDSAEARDLFFDGSTPRAFTAPFLKGVSAHGTGCTLSAAIAAHLALDVPLIDAVERAKRYLHEALSRSVPAGRGNTLNHAFAPAPLAAR